MTPDELLAAHARAHLLAAQTAAVVGAARTGLLDALLEGPGNPDELAQRLDLHADGVARVLAVLATLELVRQDEDGRYVAGELLLADAAGPTGGASNSLRVWAQIEDYLRTGRAFMHGAPEGLSRGKAYERSVAGLGRIFARVSEQLAKALGDAPGEGRILDVGAGSGRWTLVMAARDPKAHVTALDLEPVLPRFLEAAASMGLGERVDTIAADYHEVQVPPASYDRIVLANVLHLESEADAAAVLVKIAPALREGGELVVVDALPSDAHTANPSLMAYTLSLGVRTGRGRPHAEAKLRAWLSEAGLSKHSRVDLSGPESLMGALVARR